MIEMLPCDGVEDGASERHLQVIPQPVVELVPMHCDFKHQQTQHHQVILQRHKFIKV